MTWRNLLVANAAALSYKDGQIVCQRPHEEPLTVPLEDVATITLESRQITITAPLLSTLASRGIALISCDETHMPNGVLMPYGEHSRLLNVINRQIKWTLPLRIGKHLPPAGSVRSLCITDKQYARMIHWVGKPCATEKAHQKAQFLLI